MIEFRLTKGNLFEIKCKKCGLVFVNAPGITLCPECQTIRPFVPDLFYLDASRLYLFTEKLHNS